MSDDHPRADTALGARVNGGHEAPLDAAPDTALDARLLRLFAAPQGLSPVEPFVASVRSSLRRDHRRRLIGRAAVALAALLAVALGTVPLLRLSIGIAQASAVLMMRFAELVSSPLGASGLMLVGWVLLLRVRVRLRGGLRR